MQKRFNKRIHVFSISIIFLLMIPDKIQAKSVYAITDHGNSTLKAYKIQGDQIQFQEYVQVDDYASGALDATINSSRELLFLTYESSTRIVWADTRTMQQKGYIDLHNIYSAAEQLAGMTTCEEKNRIYAIERAKNNLYTLSWNSNDENLVLMNPQDPNIPYISGIAYIELTGLNNDQGYGISLNGNKLYATDNTRTVHYYDTDTWEHLGTRNLGRPVADIEIDPNNGAHPAYLYAGALYRGPGEGHQYLIKHNLEDPNSNNYIENDFGTCSEHYEQMPYKLLCINYLCLIRNLADFCLQ